jgi:hypothetical protein
MAVKMLDPVQEPVGDIHEPAARLSTLDGKILGLYSNQKLNSVRLMEMIAEDLAADYSFETRSGSYYAFRLTQDEEWGDVDKCDAVILANGDCGACSSSGIVNAIYLEKHGIPALLIATPPFVDAIRTMAELNGMGSIQHAIVEHPIGSAEEAALREKARVAAQQFRRIILRQEAGQAERRLELSAGR